MKTRPPRHTVAELVTTAIIVAVVLVIQLKRFCKIFFPVAGIVLLRLPSVGFYAVANGLRRAGHEFVVELEY